jgi:hypothetical protein
MEFLEELNERKDFIKILHDTKIQYALSSFAMMCVWHPKIKTSMPKFSIHTPINEMISILNQTDVQCKEYVIKNNEIFWWTRDNEDMISWMIVRENQKKTC